MSNRKTTDRPEIVTDEHDRENARQMRDRRRENFRLKILEHEARRWDEADLEILITHNGYQWNAMSYTREEALILRTALDAFLNDPQNRQYDIHGNVKEMY